MRCAYVLLVDIEDLKTGLLGKEHQTHWLVGTVGEYVFLAYSIKVPFYGAYSFVSKEAHVMSNTMFNWSRYVLYQVIVRPSRLIPLDCLFLFYVPKLN